MKLVRRIELPRGRELLVWEDRSPTYWAQVNNKNGAPLESGAGRCWSVWHALVNLGQKIVERRDRQKHPWHRKDFDSIREAIGNAMNAEA